MAPSRLLLVAAQRHLEPFGDPLEGTGESCLAGERAPIGGQRDWSSFCTATVFEQGPKDKGIINLIARVCIAQV